MKKILRFRTISVLFFLLFFTLNVFGQAHIRILHWNDFHAHNMPMDWKENGKIYKAGGSAYLEAYLEKYGQGKNWVVTVDAGDEFQGTPISVLTKGMSQIELLNLIRPDVFTLGNHEFDYGEGVLLKDLARAKFPVISANIFNKKTGKLFVKPYLIKTVGTVKIGFIGVITPDLLGLTLPANVRGLKILKPEQVVRKYKAMLRDSVNIFVVVSHMGVDRDMELASNVPGIDVIIGGHSHTALQQPKIINGTIICQAGSYGRFLGKLDLWVDTKQNAVVRYDERLIPVLPSAIQPNPVVAKKVNELEKQVSDELDVVIGELKTDWLRSGRSESNLGDWEADVMRQYTGTDVAFQNSGGMRKNLFAGPIRKRDLWEINPFSNYFVTFSVTGKELRKILENNVNGKGEFLQVSGLRFTYTSQKPAGQRVLSVSVDGRPLDETKTYSVCTNNFLADHFYRDFGIPRNKRPITTWPELDRNVFIQAVEKQKVIDSKIDGRILDVSASHKK
ncbi:endonuclease YhcR precursor [bacterium BMS3Abin05]|nr:endonuclease YhcR precursor [bacterium BMS3Abin05]GBE28489.1 endonuclease YhcR precursor [bacterium BMS3Bbin03]HDL77953.1 bifunctional metallophosphatase/5'-nucleotidase [Bacteroidota bacterium]HDZ11317.1 bifunctional metallophosphatase/5'-nucleotidase [Bacteroidota bacterium]